MDFLNIRARAAVVAALSIVVAACPPKTVEQVPSGGAVAAAAKEDPMRDVVEPVEGEDPFARLPPPVAPPAVAPGDVLRLGPIPRPQPGELVEPFPPPAIVRPDVPIAEVPVRVVRALPEGKIETQDSVVVAFNQPVIALSSVEGTKAAGSPFTLEPQPAGEFQWIDTQTIAFKSPRRLPYATKFRATVQAGTTLSTGKVVSETKEFTFETPLPSIEWTTPSDGSEGAMLEVAPVIQFNTDVTPDAVKPFVRWTKKGGGAVAFKITQPTTATTEGEKIVERRRVTLTPTAKLTKATDYVIEILAGMVGTEGPLALPSTVRVKFRTYDPLKVVEVTCGGWSPNEDGCPPYAGFRVQFNNALPKQAWSGLVKFSPEVPGLRIDGWGTSLSIQGEFAATTKYALTLSSAIKDVFEQTLGKDSKHALQTGSLEPMLMVGDGETAHVLEAGLPPVVPIHAVNIPKATLRVSKLTLADAHRIRTIEESGHERGRDHSAFTTLSRAADKTIELTPSAKPNTYTRSLIDLAPFLDNGLGWLLFEVDAPGLNVGRNREYYPPVRTMVVQVTDLGLTAATSADLIRVRAASLGTGKSLAGVSLRLVGPEGQSLGTATTDDSGRATLPGPVAAKAHGPFVIVATLGKDASALRLQGRGSVGANVGAYWGSSSDAPESQLLGTAYAERGTYRPGEEVHADVVVRRRTVGPKGDLQPASTAPKTVSYRVRAPDWSVAKEGTITLSAFGTGTISFVSAKDASLGDWHVEFTDGDRFVANAAFSIQEFRTPEFSVDVAHVGDEPLVTNAKTSVKVSAKYLFGAPMAGGNVHWRLTRQRASFTPPGNDGFTFPGSGGGYGEPGFWMKSMPRFGGYDEEIAGGGAVLGPDGTFVTPITLAAEEGTDPQTYTFEAEVSDQNRQVVAGRVSMLAHRSLVYAGLRLEKAVVQKIDPVHVEVVVAGTDGKRLEGRKVKVTLVERSIEVAKDADGNEQSETKEIPGASCDLVSAGKPVACDLKPSKAGHHTVRVEATDDAGRTSQAQLSVWVFDPAQPPWWKPDANARVDLVPDKRSYVPGETAHLLVNSPFPVSSGFLVVSREGFVDVRPIDLLNGSVLVDLPVTELSAPAMQVSVYVARGRVAPPPASGSDTTNLPKFASGEVKLDVSRDARRLTIDVTPSATRVSPGATVDIDLAVHDSKGNSVVSNVALMVVDEGVLSLTGFTTPDLLVPLYPELATETGAADLRPEVLERDGDDLKWAQQQGIGGAGRGGGGAEKRAMKSMAAMPAPAPMAAMAEATADMAEGGAGGPSFSVRALFKSTAFFDATIVTAKDGRAKASVKLPDNLTSFRVMAVAADDATRFGSADTQLTVRLPILVRPSLPRFLNLGDTFTASAVVNNETGTDTDVLVRLAAVNATIDGATQRIAMKAGEAKEVKFAAKAGAPGLAAFQFAVVALTKDRPTDAALVNVPTLIPATAEAFATYGSTERSVRQPLAFPNDALPGFGGLEVQLSSTALTGLQDAAKYLVEYPHECAEQTASRLVPLVGLKGILGQFGLGDEAERAALVKRAVAKLGTLQTSDGGFGLWSSSDRAWLHVSAWATFALQSAQQAGETVDASVLDRAYAFLRQRLDAPRDEWEKRDTASQSLATLVLVRAGRDAGPHLARLTKSAENKDESQFTRAFLIAANHFAKTPAATTELRRLIDNAFVETAGSVHLAERASEHLRLLMHSDDRTDAIALWALMQADPKAPVIEKLSRGVMRSRVRGRWSTTQSNAWALLAMKSYFEVYEATTPAFDARVWAGETYAGGRNFQGRTLDVADLRVPMASLLEKPPADVLVAREGQGRLYFRLGLRYAPASLQLKPEERGFLVTRTYEGLDSPTDVTRSVDGVWHVKAGANVKVTITVTAPDRRYWVALVDPMPAGFEPLEASFATTAKRVGNVDGDREDGWFRWWHWSPWNHTELRDDQARAFADDLWAGVYTHRWVARATGRGTFTVPPPRAEEMYAPETFGRGASETVVVE